MFFFKHLLCSFHLQLKGYSIIFLGFTFCFMKNCTFCEKTKKYSQVKLFPLILTCSQAPACVLAGFCNSVHSSMAPNCMLWFEGICGDPIKTSWHLRGPWAGSSNGLWGNTHSWQTINTGFSIQPCVLNSALLWGTLDKTYLGNYEYPMTWN